MAVGLGIAIAAPFGRRCPSRTGSRDRRHRSRCDCQGSSHGRASSTSAQTGACTDSPAAVRWVSPAECRVADPWPRWCVSSVLGRRSSAYRRPEAIHETSSTGLAQLHFKLDTRACTVQPRHRRQKAVIACEPVPGPPKLRSDGLLAAIRDEGVLASPSPQSRWRPARCANVLSQLARALPTAGKGLARRPAPCRP